MSMDRLIRRLDEAAAYKKDAAAKLNDMADKFQKMIRLEIGDSDSDGYLLKNGRRVMERNENWRNAVWLLRSLADAVESGDQQMIDLLYKRYSSDYLDSKYGIKTFKGFKNVKNEVKKLANIDGEAP